MFNHIGFYALSISNLYSIICVPHISISLYSIVEKLEYFNDCFVTEMNQQFKIIFGQEYVV